MSDRPSELRGRIRNEGMPQDKPPQALSARDRDGLVCASFALKAWLFGPASRGRCGIDRVFSSLHGIAVSDA